MTVKEMGPVMVVPPHRPFSLINITITDDKHLPLYRAIQTLVYVYFFDRLPVAGYCGLWSLDYQLGLSL